MAERLQRSIVTALDLLTQNATLCDMPTMTIRVDRQGVKDASKVLARMGMTPRSAIDVFLAQVALKKAIPFAVTEAESDDGYLPHVPNAATQAAMVEPTRQSFRSAKALLSSLKREH